MTVLEKAGSGSIEPEDFNRVVDELNSTGPPGTVTAADVDSQAAQDGAVLTADGAGGAAWVAQANVLTRSVLKFTETAGAGTYTAAVAVPAGCVIVDVFGRITAAWAVFDENDGLLSVGDGAGAGFYVDAFAWNNTDFNSTGLKGYGTVSMGGAFTGSQPWGGNAVKAGKFYAASGTITAVLTTDGTGGATGTFQVEVIGFGMPTGTVNAVKT